MRNKARKFLTKSHTVPKQIPYRYIRSEDFPDSTILTDIKPIKVVSVSKESCQFLLILGKSNKLYLYYPFEKSLKAIILPNTATSTKSPLVFNTSPSDRKRLFAYTSGTLVLLYEKSIRFFRNGSLLKNRTFTHNSPKKGIGLYGKFYVLLDNDTVKVFDFNGDELEDTQEDVSFFEEEEPELEDYPTIQIKSFGYDCLENLWILEKPNVLQYYEKQTYHKAFQDLDEIVFPLPAGTNNERCSDLHGIATDNNTRWSDLHIGADMPEETGILVEVSTKVNNATKTDSFTDMLDIPLYDYVGKELHVNIKLKSSPGGTLSPTVYSVKVTINQTPYVEHLPAYYQENQETLSPYLSIFQNLMDSFEEQIEKSHLKMLDPLCCDEEYLGWLSSLLGIARDYRWPEDKWRKFLDEAPSLYAGLGTKKSMQRAIKLYYGEEPDIDDTCDDNADNDCSNGNACWFFCVSLHEKKINTQRDAEVIASIIEAFKPAHTTYKLLVDYRKDAFVLGESFLDRSTQI